VTQRTFILRDERAAQALRLALSNWRTAAALETPLTVTVAAYKSRRNAGQNALLHAMLTIISESVQPDGRKFGVEEWKELVRRKFIGTEDILLPDGTRTERGLSTTTLSVGQFADLIDQVSAWAILDLGLDTTLTLKETPWLPKPVSTTSSTKLLART
jgi:hypothetical protein